MIGAVTCFEPSGRTGIIECDAFSGGEWAGRLQYGFSSERNGGPNVEVELERCWNRNSLLNSQRHLPAAKFSVFHTIFCREVCVKFSNPVTQAFESAVKQRGGERKGPPEIIQKFRLRNWPISSADFPMTLMEGTEQHFVLPAPLFYC